MGYGSPTAPRAGRVSPGRRTWRALPLLLVAALAGCASGPERTGRPYAEAVSRLETGLALFAAEDRIMAFSKEHDDRHTVLRFVDGSRQDEAAHAFPLRVAVTILPEQGGSDSSISVEAIKHGLKSQARDRAAEARWEVELVETVRLAPAG